MPNLDTIVALSTPVGESAIAMLRLSGPKCEDLAKSLLGRLVVRPRYAYFLNYQSIENKLLDDCLMTYFESGKSFTGEAMLEIAPHGNPMIVQRILEDLYARGCRPAEPGEFTKTAFLNGKMDLSQAEAVSDLIRARSERSIEIAQRQLHGSIGHKMSELTERLLSVMAHIEAYIDFPEEDLPAEDQSGPAQDLRQLINEIKALSETQRYSALMHEGIKTLIVGEPNAGKSSLINALTGEQRAIVSDIAGTTRDFIASYIMIGSWRIEILDTAGIRDASDEIERLGVQHTIDQAQTADFFIWMLDSTQPSPTLPDLLADKMNAANTIILENKIDLGKFSDELVGFEAFDRSELSLTTSVGLEDLRKLWETKLDDGIGSFVGTDGLVVNARHAAALNDSVAALELASLKMRDSESSELVAADLRDAIESIGEVVGRVDNERMLDTLFKQFCIGK